jgi:hypothetical protein
MQPTIAQIEQMIIDLLPIENDQPDMDGTGTEIARIVSQATEVSHCAELGSFFKSRSSEEGWREIAVVLAKALLTIDKEHRAIIKAIRSE